MTITIEQAIATHGALHVYREIDFEPGCAERMVALGLTAPQTLADVWRAHAAAHAALSAEEMRGERRELRVRVAYMASACKVGRAPRMPRNIRYTR